MVLARMTLGLGLFLAACGGNEDLTPKPAEITPERRGDTETQKQKAGRNAGRPRQTAPVYATRSTMSGGGVGRLGASR